jgi:hypothetical protein
MKKTNKPARLRLSTETLRRLQPDQLQGVAGGILWCKNGQSSYPTHVSGCVGDCEGDITFTCNNTDYC